MFLTSAGKVAMRLAFPATILNKSSAEGLSAIRLDPGKRHDVMAPTLAA
jgi:hypothetical protein